MNEISQLPAKPRRVGYGPLAAVLVTIGVYFISQAVVGLIISLLPLLTGWSVERLQDWLRESVAAKFLTILLLEAVTLWLLWLFLKVRKVSLKAIGLVAPQSRDAAYAIVGYVTYFVALVILSVVAKALIPGLDFEQDQEIGFNTAVSGPALGFVFLSLVVLPPITEEIVTRGFLYTGLRSKLPKLAAAVITSILFAAAHLQWGSGNGLLWVAALDTFVLSLILVYLREKTGSLWSPILIHTVKNSIAFYLLFISKVT